MSRVNAGHFVAKETRNLVSYIQKHVFICSSVSDAVSSSEYTV
jgi:hypothetical protein